MNGRNAATSSAPTNARSGTSASPSQPRGGGALRGIGEKFAANPVNGTGSMSVPIATSPGRGGASPQLTLTYDSGGGNGPFGLGWGLSLPGITRRTDKGLPLYQDAHDTDVFVLAGVEDLVPVYRQDLDGSWVATHPGFTRDANGGWVRNASGGRLIHEDERNGYLVRRYRPRTEGLFARIERWTQRDTGGVHWRTISRDNVTTLYGLDDGSRLTDSATAALSGSPPRIFGWLVSESYDDRGNAFLYQYQAEDDRGIATADAHERHRLGTATTQRYLKRIRYGNRTPRANGEDLAQRTDWMFEVVFDYGDHGGDTPTPEASDPWPERRDSFTQCRAGFEIRTRRLCRRVLLFHHFPTEGAAGPDEPAIGRNCLVRATEFTYDQTPVASYLTAVVQASFRRRGAGYSRRAYPPVTFEYSRAMLSPELKTLDTASAANLPQGIDGTQVHFVDLYGEGISGALTEQAGAWYYKRNLSPLTLAHALDDDGRVVVHGDARFEALAPVTALPSPGRLSGEQQLQDLAGDGRPDLVQFAPPLAGFFTQGLNGDWRNFTPFPRQPVIDWANPNLRHIDLTGDGFADLMLTRDEGIEWYRSLARDGFAQPEFLAHPPDDEDGPRRVFADGAEALHLADMNGDGLADLVRVRNGEICYWPSLGYGRFGPKVVMDGAPVFDRPDQFDPKRVRLADIDGSGVTDLIYLGHDAVRIYLNESGNGWAPAQSVTTFPNIDNLATVQALDLLGNGTACLVWSSPLEHERRTAFRYIDLMGGQKPHLLVTVRNNLGAETHIRYLPSTRFYLEDLQAGRPWLTRLPFPVQVVERVETFDRVSRNWFVTRYRYHHGYFDGVEREFRGFGLVEQLDTETFNVLKSDANAVLGQAENIDAASHVPPLHTKTWYHTGASLIGEQIAARYAAEYYREPGLDDQAARRQLLDDTVLPVGLTLDEEREACRALKGQILRQEVYATDGTAEAEHPYTVSERNYTIEVLQAQGTNAHAVFYVHQRETLDFHYERHPRDPRIAHGLVLQVDAFGNVQRSLSIGYGRRPGQSPLVGADRALQETMLATYTEGRYTERDPGVDWSDAHRAPLPCEVRTYELTGLTIPASATRVAFETWVANDFAALNDFQSIAFEVDPAPPLKQKRLIEVVRTLYRRDDLADLLTIGRLQPLALEGETYKLALTPGRLDVFTDRVAPAALATLLRTEGGYVDLDNDGHWWLPSGRVFFHPDANATSGQERAQAAAHFYLARRMRDAFGHDTRVDYDAHDLAVALTRDAVGNTITTETNYRVLQAWRTTDANGARTSIAYDTLGLAVATATTGRQAEGDTLDGVETDLTPAQRDAFFAAPRPVERALLGRASTRTVYDVDRFAQHGTPMATGVLTREIHASEPDGAQSPVQVTVIYSDGLGREIQTKRPAEPGPLAEGGPIVAVRWVGTGWTIFNNKGKPVRRFEPFFSATHDFEFGRQVGVGSMLFYDPLGREIGALHPHHAYEKVVFDAWQQANWDVNDTLALRPGADPDVSGYFERLVPADFSPSWQERQLASADANERNAAVRTAAHAGTPSVAHFDALGRSVLSIADNGVDGAHPTRVAVDIQGHQRSVTDARGNTLLRSDFNLVGQAIRQNSPETGTRWLLTTVTGKPLRTWNSRGFVYRFAYDGLERQTALFVTESGTERLAEQIVYGEAKPSAEATYHRGQIWQVRDEAGILTHLAYDLKGNALRMLRELRDVYKTPVDWSQPAPALSQAYGQTREVDALSRPVRLTTPDGSVTTTRYNEAGLLDSVSVTLPGGVATPSVRNVDYDARGQRTRIEYGTGAFSTEYRYDPETFRLRRLITTRPAHADATARVLQDLRPIYDPAGHIVHIEDAAQPRVFFDNACIDAGRDYRFDALYRLVGAAGREHAGDGLPPDWTDAARTGQPLPSNCAELRRYVETYRYDGVGNLLQQTHHVGPNLDSPGQVLWNRRFQYRTTNNQLRGTSAPGEAALPDYADDPAARYTERYAYDAHGNLADMPHLAGLSWDAEDRLAAVDLQGGGKAYYVYGAHGQRLRKVVERLGATVEEHLYLGEYEVDRRSVNGTLQRERRSLSVLDDRERVALFETLVVDAQAPVNAPASLARYQLSDPLGSVALEVDEAARVISYEEYYPYGSTALQATDQVREVPAKRYRYLGKERDAEHGLSYHEARYYAPWLGRWISPDPAGFGDGVNLYVYARSSPTTRTDANGRQSKRIVMESEIVILNDSGKVKIAQKSRREGVIDASGQVKLGKEVTRNMNKAERDKAQAHMDALRKEMREKTEAEERAKQDQDKQRAYKEDKNYKLVVAVNVSSTDRKGNVQSSQNPGHTFVAIKDPSGKIVKILSYGPEKAFGVNNIACSGPGTTSYHLLNKDDYNTFEYDITQEQSDKALKKIDEIEKSPGTYSANHQCTTVALDVTDAAGLSTIPRGKGNIDVPLCSDAKNVSTPYHLNKELQDAKVPYKTQKGSDFAGHGIPVQ